MDREQNKVVVYCRTSTNKQDIKSQIYQTVKFCDQNNWLIVKYFKDEGKSGLDNEREGLNELLKFLTDNKVDKLILTEISRLSRNVDKTKEIINFLTSLNISIYIIDNGFETMNGDKLNYNVLSYIENEIFYSNEETKKLCRRLNRGLDLFKQNGGKLGRKKGSLEKENVFMLKHVDIIDFLKSGLSIRLISNVTGKAPATVQKVKKILNKNNSLNDVKKITKTDFVNNMLNTKSDVINEIVTELMFNNNNNNNNNNNI